ncbi:MAG: YciI family protein [Chitinophagaceae bacterium]|nr:YciI family protein [Chitinophagaceae bacterium]
MKNVCMLLALLCLAWASPAQTTAGAAKDQKPKYEMKQYWFVMLVKGKDRDKITDTARINQLQAGHMANMQRMADMGKLIVAGPFGDDGHWRGIFIFDAASREEVEALLKTDPAISAGRLDYEIHPWWTAKGTVFK